MMKKILIMTFGAILMSMLVACGGNEVDNATAEKYITQAKEVIALLNESNYEEVHGMFNSEMKTGLPVKNMSELTPIIKESGAFKEISKASVEEQDGLYIAVLAAKYSNENRVFTITFNNDEEVAGLYVK